MGKKSKAKVDAAFPASPAAAAAPTPAAHKDERTFSAASGRSFVIAQEAYPPAEELPPALRADVAAASEGDLLELLSMHEDWGYGRRFKEREGAVNEGAFHLDWVHGVRQVIENGRRRPVEVDVRSGEFGFQPQRAGDATSKLRQKRWLKRMTDAAASWRGLAAGGEASQRAAAEAAEAAAQAAAALEREESARREQIRKKVEQLREKQRAKEAATAAEERVEDVAAAAQRAGGREEASESSGPDLAAGPFAAQRPEPAAAARPRQAEERVRRAFRPRFTAPAEPPVEASCGAAVKARPPEAGGDGAADESGSGGGQWEDPARRGAWPPPRKETWDAQWEMEAAQLEAVLSASSSGVEDGESGRRPRQTSQKRTTTRKLTKGLLDAKRSGELHAIAEEWEKAHAEMANQASDLSALSAKVKQSLLNTPQEGDLERIAEEMASEAERKAAEVKELKERVFRAMLDVRRRRKLERTATEMDDAQKELEMKALQLKSLMRRAFKGMQESKRSSVETATDPKADDADSEGSPVAQAARKPGADGTSGHLLASGEPDARGERRSGGGESEGEVEGGASSSLACAGDETAPARQLERIASEMAERMQTRADALRARIRQAMLRAHRAGELLEMREELDELADSVVVPPDSSLDEQATGSRVPPPPGGGRARRGAGAQAAAARVGSPERSAPRRRWHEFSSSDSDMCWDAAEGMTKGTRPARGGREAACPASPSEADVSGSDLER